MGKVQTDLAECAIGQAPFSRLLGYGPANETGTRLETRAAGEKTRFQPARSILAHAEGDSSGCPPNPTNDRIPDWATNPRLTDVERGRSVGDAGVRVQEAES